MGKDAVCPLRKMRALSSLLKLGPTLEGSYVNNDSSSVFTGHIKDPTKN